MGTNDMLCDRMPVINCLKIQFQMGSLLFNLLDIIYYCCSGQNIRELIYPSYETKYKPHSRGRI